MTVHRNGSDPSHAHAPVSATPERNHATGDDRSKAKRAGAGALVRVTGVDRIRPDRSGLVPEDEALFLAEGFGAYVRALRTQVGVSQGRASSLCGLSVSHISKLERGVRRPSVPAVKALARILAPDGDTEALEQRLAGLAGESLRHGADRKKLQAVNRSRREALRDMKANTAKMRRLIRGREASGQVISGTQRRILELGESLVEKLEAEPIRKHATIKGFLGDDE